MKYAVVVYNAKGKEVFRKIYEGVSGSYIHEVYKDYAHHGGPGGYADFFPL